MFNIQSVNRTRCVIHVQLEANELGSLEAWAALNPFQLLHKPLETPNYTLNHTDTNTHCMRWDNAWYLKYIYIFTDPST
jgi:hypothetical protein